MGAGVRDGPDFLDGPAVAIGVDEVLGLDAEELLHLGQSFAVVTDVMDLGRHGLAGGVVLKGDTEVDEPDAWEHHAPSSGSAVSAIGSESSQQCSDWRAVVNVVRAILLVLKHGCR